MFTESVEKKEEKQTIYGWTLFKKNNHNKAQ